MKQDSRLSVFFSTAAYYSIKTRRDQGEMLARIGTRIGSKLPLLRSLSRSLVTAAPDSWGKAICAQILPALGITSATYGISRYTQRLVVKLPKQWESADPALCLPVVPAVIERVFAGWSIPVAIDVQTDRSVLLVVAPLPAAEPAGRRQPAPGPA